MLTCYVHIFFLLAFAVPALLMAHFCRIVFGYLLVLLLFFVVVVFKVWLNFDFKGTFLYN